MPRRTVGLLTCLGLRGRCMQSCSTRGGAKKRCVHAASCVRRRFRAGEVKNDISVSRRTCSSGRGWCSACSPSLLCRLCASTECRRAREDNGNLEQERVDPPAFLPIPFDAWHWWGECVARPRHANATEPAGLVRRLLVTPPLGVVSHPAGGAAVRLGAASRRRAGRALLRALRRLGRLP